MLNFKDVMAKLERYLVTPTRGGMVIDKQAFFTVEIAGDIYSFTVSRVTTDYNLHVARYSDVVGDSSQHFRINKTTYKKLFAIIAEKSGQRLTFPIEQYL